MKGRYDPEEYMVFRRNSIFNNYIGFRSIAYGVVFLVAGVFMGRCSAEEAPDPVLQDFKPKYVTEDVSSLDGTRWMEMVTESNTTVPLRPRELGRLYPVWDERRQGAGTNWQEYLRAKREAENGE